MLCNYLDLECTGDCSLADLLNDYEENRAPAFSAVADLLRIIMWRNTKATVAREVSLPPVTRYEVFFELDPLERALYVGWSWWWWGGLDPIPPPCRYEHELFDLRRKTGIRNMYISDGLSFLNRLLNMTGHCALVSTRSGSSPGWLGAAHAACRP